MTRTRIFLYTVVLMSPLTITARFGWLSSLGIPWGSTAQKDTPTMTVYRAGGLEQRQQELQAVEHQLRGLQAKDQEFTRHNKTQLDRVSGEIAQLKQTHHSGSNKDRDNNGRRLMLLNEAYQVIVDTQLVRNDLLSTLKEHADILKKYVEDPQLKSLCPEERTYYTFEQLNRFTGQLFKIEDQVNYLTEQKYNTEVEIANRVKDNTHQAQIFAAKEKEHATLVSRKNGSIDESEYRRQGQLFDDEKLLHTALSNLFDLKVQMLQHRLVLIDVSLAIAQEQQTSLKQSLQKIKSDLRVSAHDVSSYEKEFVKHRERAAEATKEYYQQINAWIAQKDKLSAVLNSISERIAVPVSDMKLFPELLMQAESPDRFAGLCSMGAVYERIHNLEAQIAVRTAHIDIKKERIRAQELVLSMMRTWHKITTRRLRRERDMAEERQQYDRLRTDLERVLSSIKERRATVATQLNTVNKTLNMLRDQARTVEHSKSHLFSHDQVPLLESLGRMREMEQLVVHQIELLTKLNELYAHLIAIVSATMRNAGSIMNELNTIGIWHRSERALSWHGITHIGGDIKMFSHAVFVAVKGLFSRVTLWRLYKYFKGIIFKPLQLLSLLLIFLMGFGFFWGLRRIGPALQQILTRIAAGYSRIGPFLARIGLFLLLFITTHARSLCVWGTILTLILLDIITNINFEIIFYILSIPYLLYIATRLILSFVSYNQAHNYGLVNQIFLPRFLTVFTIFMYSSAFLLPLREAMVLSNFHRSELPLLIMAIYSILLRVLLIFSIGKEEILSVIPDYTTAWEWVRSIVSRFYYAIVGLIITLMVVSDPYIGGYSSLVWYIIGGLVMSAIMIRVFSILYTTGRQFFTKIFFTSEGEGALAERFEYAKVWYGITVLTFAITIALCGIMLGGKIWGYPITITDIIHVFRFKILEVGVGVDKKEITLEKFFILIAFIVGAFITAAGLVRFMLTRLFDVFFIDSGLQNTIASVIRYCVVILIILIGLQKVGLDSLIIYLGAIIISLGWAAKELVYDFASYFIILVQRPIKIGDYIMIDGQTQGTVRKITPRSVIMRKNDSLTMVVPNSVIINKVVYNWNYSVAMCPLDDIFFTVPYSVDPQRVKQIVLGVFSSNPLILKSPAPVIRLQDFAEAGFLFMIRGFVSSVHTQGRFDIASDIRLALVRAFGEQQITFAVPQRVIVHSPKDVTY